MKHKILLALLSMLLMTSIAAAQDKSYNAYKDHPERYAMSLRTILADAQTDLGITITWDKKVEPYLDKTVPVAPWKLSGDPQMRLAAFLFPLELSFEKTGENSWRVFEPWYYMRPEAEGKAHLERLLKRFPNRESWEKRKADLRSTILDRLQLTKLVARKTDLHPVMSEPRKHDGYTVRNVALEILPGCYLNGSLYEPTTASGKRSIVLCPHGHGADGRIGDDQQYRSATLARMGAVCFCYSMFSWLEQESPLKNENHKDPIAGSMQTLGSIRVIDFLSSLPNVDTDRIGITGCSGGGTQTFLATAVDDRIRLSVPVVMVSSHFYGGCPCESGVPFHLACGGTCNAEIAAMAAPRPTLLIGVTKDWTHNLKTVEYPYIKSIYKYYGQEDKVEYAFFDEAHNYGASKRNAMYPFIAKHFKLDLKQVDETKVTIEKEAQMLVFGPDHAKYPANGVQTLEQVKKVFDEQKNL